MSGYRDQAGVESRRPLDPKQLLQRKKAWSGQAGPNSLKPELNWGGSGRMGPDANHGRSLA